VVGGEGSTDFGGGDKDFHSCLVRHPSYFSGGTCLVFEKVGHLEEGALIGNSFSFSL
jgi:hypothetical protein